MYSCVLELAELSKESLTVSLPMSLPMLSQSKRDDDSSAAALEG